jgi:hypothetical protein
MIVKLRQKIRKKIPETEDSSGSMIIEPRQRIIKTIVETEGSVNVKR